MNETITAIVHTQFACLAGIFDEGDQVQIVSKGEGKYSILSKNGSTYCDSCLASFIGPRPLSDIFKKVLTMNYHRMPTPGC